MSTTPPLAEQHRIVAEVDPSMTLCDALASRLRNGRECGGGGEAGGGRWVTDYDEDSI